MTQEEKDLVLCDLCARLPYGVIGLYSWKNREPYNRELTGCLFDELKSSWDSTEDSQFSPYLRPLSSMTEEELYEVQEILGKEAEIRDGFISIIGSSINSFTYLELQAVFEWFNTYHFDYRGLIEKGLAIEVTEENNPYKD